MRHALPIVAAVMALVCGTAPAHALPTETYASTSRLATGRWYKISVPSSGLYTLTAAALNRMGFRDRTRVRVYGYGAMRPADALTAANYWDDLPPVQTVTRPNGDLVFYANGPETWTRSTSGRFVSTLNMYTNVGYYFVTEVDAAADSVPAIETVGYAEDRGGARSFNERVQHEKDIATPGEAGGHLLGEDFRYTPRRQFTINTPGRVADTDVWMESSFVAKTSGSASKVSFTVNGQKLPELSSDNIQPISDASHQHGNESVSRRLVSGVSQGALTVEVVHTSPVIVSGAWLNYLAINYQRHLDLGGDSGGALVFEATGGAFSIGGATAGTTVLDVTDPFSIKKLNLTAPDGEGRVAFANSYGGYRVYAAFTESARLPEPALVGAVANQNMHADGGADMVIFTHRAWQSAAERIAAIHRAEGMTVNVVDVDRVYNEFSSGSPDIHGLRKYLKMIYDRSQHGDTALRYCLVMGRATYDHRHNTPGMANAAATLPSWVGGTVKQSLHDNDGLVTDDFLAMLEDGEGSSKGSDSLSVAVGRIPCTSLSMADSYVDKLQQFMTKSRNTPWRNQVMIVSDDEDNNVHLNQSESMSGWIERSAPGQFIVNKVYLDSYIFTGGVYPQARSEMFRYLDEGTMLWTYIGHANNHSMTGEGQLTYPDIMSMYLKQVPILYAATCDFLRWDSTTESGGEILFNERYGGCIAVLSATRPVYIYDNGMFSEAMGRQLGAREADGRLGTLGDIYRRAKNNILQRRGNSDYYEKVSNENRLRYVLMGDPAMRIVTPDNRMRLDSVAGQPAIEGPDAPVIAARQTATFSGAVTDPAGNVINDYEGTLTAMVYDAEKSVTTYGRGEAEPATFDTNGDRLFAGSAPIRNGRFSLQVTIPSEIADNFRPASINLYAVPADSLAGTHAQAIGVSRAFYISGYDDQAPLDTLAPRIDEFYLNHPTFADGALVNPTPVAIARVSDDVAINLSASGVGHNMRLSVDGGTTVYNDVALYYTPSPDGSPSGTINYPLTELREGPHELTLRICDAEANVTERTISFMVSADAAPKIYEIYSDANPATTQANFYLTHNRPDQMVTVTVSVYNLLGTPLWTKSVTGISDMFTSMPVTWDLCDGAGHRVPRGIYLYRATISADGDAHDTATHRIAVGNP